MSYLHDWLIIRLFQSSESVILDMTVKSLKWTNYVWLRRNIDRVNVII